MSHLTSQAASESLSIRSTILICLTMITTRLSRQLMALSGKSPLSVEFRNRHRVAKGSANPCRLLDITQDIGKLPVGSHLISPRRFYTHHGIHLGGGEIAHYSGFCSSFRPGPIEATTIERFANGNTVWVVQEQCEFSNDEIASRARSRIGECQYRLLSNNCEHFCSWCINGKSYSAQVNAYFGFSVSLFTLNPASRPDFIA